MGLVDANGLGMSGIVAAPVDVQVFTSSGTWTQPAGCTRVYIECIAGGSGGGAGNSGSGGRGGGGGSGGAIARSIFDAKSLAGSLTIVVGGTAGAASAGSHSQVTSGSTIIIKTYGGGPGENGRSDRHIMGSGGGGTGTVGAANATNHWKGGYPDIQGSTHGNSLGGRGGAGSSSDYNDYHDGGNSEYGGGGGGGGGGAGGLGAGHIVYSSSLVSLLFRYLRTLT